MADHIQIGDISPRIQYAGDGVQTVFTYPFPIFVDANIDVYEDTGLKTITTHYTVAGAGSSTGGTVTFITAPAVGIVVTLMRNIAVERTSDFQESGEFRAKVINDELDKLTATQQQIEADQDRSLRLGPTDSAISTIIPAKATRSGKVLGFDATTGDPIVSNENLSAIEGASTSAAAAAVDALSAAVDAATATSKAAEASASAALALGASTGKYDTHINIAFADSPYAVGTLLADTLITVDTSGGAVIINLPAASGETDNRLLGINKNGATNSITIAPNGADTVGGLASFIQYDDTEWADLYLDKANTNWQLGNLSFTAVGTGLTKIGSTISLDAVFVGYDIAFQAGFAANGTSENIALQTYGNLVMARSGAFTGDAAYMDTAPAGAKAKMDVTKNGVSIYTTLPDITAGLNTGTAGTLKVDGTANFVSGDRIAFKITQTGISTIGTGLRFTLKGKVT